jgi:hypothetical protein
MSIEKPGSYRSRIHPENFGDLIVRQSLDIVEGYHRSMVFGQLEKGFVQPTLKFSKVGFAPRGLV